MGMSLPGTFGAYGSASSPKNLNKDVYSGFPSPFASEDEKAKDSYGSRYFRAMYGEFAQSSSTFSYESRNQRYILNRKYAEGLQSIQKYKDLLSTQGDNSYLNLDWNALSIIPKFVDVVVNGMVNQEHKIQCSAIDPLSRDKRDKKRNELYAKMRLKDFSDELEERTGVAMLGKGEQIMESKEDIDLYMQLTYKQALEIAMEQGVEYVFYENDWEMIKRKILRDLVVNKIGAARILYDENGDIKIRYVDIVNLIVSYTKHDNFESVRHAGEITYMTISELRQATAGKLSDKELWVIAKTYAGKNGNKRWTFGDRYYYSGLGSTSNNRAYDDYLVSVLDGEFYSTNKMVYRTKDNKKTGGYYFDKKDSNYKEPKRSKRKREVIERDIQVVYSGKWIVGTNHVYDYGLKTNMTREKLNGIYSSKTSLGFIMFSPDIYDMENKSLVERMIPHADQMQITHLKIQQLIAKARPPGVAFDISALQGVMKGMANNKHFNPLSISEIYDQIGNLYYSSVRDDGSTITTNPIQELDNGIRGDLEKLVGIYNHNMQQIRDMTGINEIADGSSTDKDALVGIEKMRLAASNNATRTVDISYTDIFERTAKEAILMIQDSIDMGMKIEGWYKAIGENNVTTFELNKGVALAEYGMQVVSLPDAIDREYVESNIQNALTGGTLRIEDAISVRDISKRNTKLANQLLIQRQKQYAKERMEEASAAAEDNARVQGQAAEQKANAEANAKVVAAKAEIEVLNAQAEVDSRLQEQKSADKIAEIDREGEWKSKHIMQASDEDFKKTALNKQVSQPAVFPEAKAEVTP